VSRAVFLLEPQQGFALAEKNGKSARGTRRKFLDGFTHFIHTFAQWVRYSACFGAAVFRLIHILAIGIFFVHFRWSYLITCWRLSGCGCFSVTAGYHRYFANRSYKTSRMFQVIAFLAMTSSQKGVLWCAGHHRHADQELDQHSPTLFGFFWISRRLVCFG
jgi:fatty-acid desaturase